MFKGNKKAETDTMPSYKDQTCYTCFPRGTLWPSRHLNRSRKRTRGPWFDGLGPDSAVRGFLCYSDLSVTALSRLCPDVEGAAAGKAWPRVACLRKLYSLSWLILPHKPDPTAISEDDFFLIISFWVILRDSDSGLLICSFSTCETQELWLMFRQRAKWHLAGLFYYIKGCVRHTHKKSK